MHQGKKKNLMLSVSLIRQAHQVRLKKVHQGEEIFNWQGCKRVHASGKVSLQLRPWPGLALDLTVFWHAL
jgi:hypothetical protein